MAWALRVGEGSVICQCGVRITDTLECEHTSSEDSLFSMSHIEKSLSSTPEWGGGISEISRPTILQSTLQEVAGKMNVWPLQMYALSNRTKLHPDESPEN